MTDLNPVDAMTNEFRAMCAELVDSIELLLEMRAVDAKPMAITEDCLSRARALLDQPVAEGPTDDKLMDIARATDLVYYMGEDCGFASPYMEGTDITAEVLAYARAALAKWGHQ